MATYRNLMLTMVLGGLWHGAGWTFILWGILHGIMLCGDRLLALSPGKTSSLGTQSWLAVLKVVTTFHLVCLGWLLFRAESVSQAWSMLALILTDLHVTAFSKFASASILFYILPLMAYEFWLLRGSDLDRLVKTAWPIRATVYCYIAVMILLFHPIVSHEFIYFQF